jgi:hypothetical protein
MAIGSIAAYRPHGNFTPHKRLGEGGKQVMRSLVALLCLCLGAEVASVGVTSAATIDDGAQLRTDCNGYTLTFQGQTFAQGETVTITWTITLLQGSTPTTIIDSATFTSTTSNPAPVFTITKPWNMVLSGAYDVLNCGGEGFYSWVSSTGGSSASAWQLIDPATGNPIAGPPPFENCANTARLTCATLPVVAQCRGPRFWGRRAGEEAGRRNLTDEVLDAVGFIGICGQTLDTTNLNTAFSAEEALCVRGSSDDRLRLARQLTATALNCVMSNAGPNCTGINIGARFNECNDACAVNNNPGLLSACISDLHCWNRGGVKLSSGMCQIGTCNGDGVTACSGDDSCSGETEPSERSDCDLNNDEDDETGVCVRTANNCRQQPLVNTSLGLDFTQPGKASSASGCKEARKNNCTIFACGCN